MAAPTAQPQQDKVNVSGGYHDIDKLIAELQRIKQNPNDQEVSVPRYRRIGAS